MTRVRHIVLAGLCAAAALAYFTRNGVAPAESTIRAALDITKEQSGLLMSAFFWSYALFQIPAAMLARHFGERWTLAGCAVLWSLATAALATGELQLMIASRACMGLAQAGLVPIGVSAMARWFPQKAQASAAGAFGGFMSVGSIIAAPLTGWLVIEIGWRTMFVLYAIPGVLWALWFATWYRDQPAAHPAINTEELALIQEGKTIANTAAQAVSWSRLLAHPALWLLCLQQICRAAGYIFFASWFATYLQEARGVSVLKSGWLTALPLFADITGCLFGGFLSDAVLRRSGSQSLARRGVATTALLLCALLIFSAWFVAQPLLAVLVISAGMFCAAVANPCYSATLMTLGREQTATLSATTNMCGNLGAAAFPMLVPVLLAHAGGWDAVLVGFGSLYLVAAVFWLLMRVEKA